MLDRRKNSRSRVYLGARVEFDDRATLDCVIRDLSDSGARLECSSHVTLPSRFTVLVNKHGERREALAVWRQEDALGVIFPAAERRRTAQVLLFDRSRRAVPPTKDAS